MTVAAAARVSRGTVDISQGVRGKSTDGVAFTSDDSTAVQWAALLAPPVLSPTSTFTLVIDSSDFEVPAFDMTVQPGLSTDPTIGGLVQSAFSRSGTGAVNEQQILKAVGDVSKQLTEARDFVDEIHSALREDVSSIAGRTFTDLQSSSQQVSSGLKSMSDQLAQILSSTGSALQGASSSTQSNLRSLVSSFVEIIGTNASPKMTSTAVEGCSLTLPQLAEGEALSVTSSFALLDAQMSALGQLFSDSEGTSNCRGAMLASFVASIGDPKAYDDPDSQAVRDCQEPDSADRSLSCVLRRLDTGVESSVGTAMKAKKDAELAVGDLGASSFVTAVGDLADALNMLSADAKALQTDDAISTASLKSAVKSVIAKVEDAEREFEGLRTQAQSLEQSATALQAGLGSTDAVNPGLAVKLRELSNSTNTSMPVGAWFLDSQMADGITRYAEGLNASGSSCDLQWARGLRASSTAIEITAALQELKTDACPIESLTGPSIELVNGYQNLSDSVSGLGSQLLALSAAADVLESNAQDLATKAGELKTGLADGSELEANLRALYDGRTTADHPKATGLLVDLSKTLETKNSASQVGITLADIVTSINAIWPDSTVMPTPPEGQCTATQPAVSEAPQAPGQAVVWLTNRLACQNESAVTSLAEVGKSLETAQSAAKASIETAQSGALETVSQFGAQLDSLGAQVQGVLDKQSQLTRDNAASLLEQSKKQTDAQLAQALDSLSVTMTSTINDLNSALTRSTEETSVVASQLASQFETLLLNLGQPQSSSRLGLIGKLNGVTTDVGETGNVIDGVGTTVNSLGDSRKGALRRIALQNTVYASAESRLADYKPFAQQGTTPVTTVVTFSMGGRR